MLSQWQHISFKVPTITGHSNVCWTARRVYDQRTQQKFLKEDRPVTKMAAVQKTSSCHFPDILVDLLKKAADHVVVMTTWPHTATKYVWPKYLEMQNYVSTSYYITEKITLQWSHNGHDGVSNHQPRDCLLNCLFGRRSKTSKLRVTGLCVGNSPVAGEFPAQMVSNVENVSIWWRHHDIIETQNNKYPGCSWLIFVYRKWRNRYLPENITLKKCPFKYRVIVLINYTEPMLITHKDIASWWRHHTHHVHKLGIIHPGV